MMIGISAGKICFSNFDSIDHPGSTVIDGAETMWESGRSAWVLVEEGLDGGTSWRSPEGKSFARVSASGQIIIEPAI